METAPSRCETIGRIDNLGDKVINLEDVKREIAD